MKEHLGFHCHVCIKDLCDPRFCARSKDDREERVETAPSVPQGRSTPGVGHCALGGDECSEDTGERRGAECPCLRTVEGTKALWSGVASHLIIHLYSPLWAHSL